MAKNNIVFSMILNNTDFVKNMNLSRGEVRKLERQVNGATGTLSNMVKGGLMPMLGPLAGVASGAALAAGAFARSTEKMLALDSAMAEMRALLGATEEQMERFKMAAIGMATGSSVAADEIIRAMIKVGGAMPQLLEFEEGLKAVTDSALTLSAASGMTLDDSINSLTSIMNQFGASAMDSERYINVLAAASQAGSAEIDYLAEAVAKAGGAATAADMQFEELVALIEAIAPKFGKAEEAGTALRSVLLKMETGSEKTKISTQGLAAALENLSLLSTDELLKKFGLEGINMAKAMISAREAFDGFNTAVRDTDAAHEQAALRTASLSGAIDVLVNKWDAFTLSINNSSGPLTSVVNLLGKAVDYANELVMSDADKETARMNAQTKQGMRDAPGMLKEHMKEGVTEAEALKATIGDIKGQLEELRDGIKSGKISNQRAFSQIRLAGDRVYNVNPDGSVEANSPLAHVEGFYNKHRDQIKSMYGGAISLVAPAFGAQMLTESELSKAIKKDAFDHPTAKKKAEMEIEYLEGALKALEDKLNTSKKGGGNGGGGGGDGDSIFARGMNLGNGPLGMITRDVVPDISAFDKSIKGATINVAKLGKATNPWQNRYVDDWWQGDVHQKIGFAHDAASTVANASGSAGALIARIPGLENIGNGIQEITSVVMDVMNVIQGVSAVIEMANGIQAGIQSTTVTANTAAIAVNTSAMIGLTAAIGANTMTGMIPLFSDGGIIGGNSWTGDKLLARVNSGEMVLNAEQQKNLLNGLNHSGVSVNLEGGTVRLKGEDIYVALKNHLRSTGKTL